LVAFIPFKIISLSSNTLHPSLATHLEALFKGCLLNRAQFICHTHNYVHHHSKPSFQGHFILGNRKSLDWTGQDRTGQDRTGQMKEGVEGQESNALLRTLKSTVLRELVHCHDGGAKFVWSTFLVVFFIPHPSHALDLLDTKPD
jgi:hypothetical protein